MTPPSRGARFLNAAALTLVVLLAMMASCASTMPSGCTKDKAYVTAARSDLRNMFTAQEEFHDKFGRFAAGNEVYSEEFGYFRNSTGVVVYIEFADAKAFRARAQHRGVPGTTCVISSADGEPRCYGVQKRPQPPRWRRNVALNISVDLWLFAITLARRQRRLSRAMASKEFAPAA